MSLKLVATSGEMSLPEDSMQKHFHCLPDSFNKATAML